MIDLMGRVRRLVSNMETKSAHGWKELVLKVVDEKIPEEADVLRTLEALGKTLDQLEVAVKLVKRRRATFASIAEAERIQEEGRKAQKLMDAAAARFDPIEEKHEQLMEQYSHAIRHAQYVEHQVRSGRQELCKSCNDEELLARYRDAQAVVQRATEAVQQNDELMKDCQSYRHSNQNALENMHPGMQVTANPEIDAMRDKLERSIEKHNKARESHAAAVDARKVAMVTVSEIELEMEKSEI